MIKKTQAFVASDGTVWSSLEQAQEKELVLILEKACKGDDAYSQTCVKDLAVLILTNKDQLLDILTTSPSSRPPARKINGGTKPRKTKPSQDLTSIAPSNKGLLAGTQHT